jgi:hypothetical protein
MYLGKPHCTKDRSCLLNKISGHCEAYIPSYWYNSATDSCESFIYGGCGGNANRFPTLLACQNKCQLKEIGNQCILKNVIIVICF